MTFVEFTLCLAVSIFPKMLWVILHSMIWARWAEEVMMMMNHYLYLRPTRVGCQLQIRRVIQITNTLFVHFIKSASGDACNILASAKKLSTLTHHSTAIVLICFLQRPSMHYFVLTRRIFSRLFHSFFVRFFITYLQSTKVLHCCWFDSIGRRHVNQEYKQI